mgnify:FL=1
MKTSPFQKPCEWPGPKDRRAIIQHARDERDQRELAQITPLKLNEMRASIQRQNYDSTHAEAVIPSDDKADLFLPGTGRARPYLPRLILRFERCAYQCPKRHVLFYWYSVLLEKPPASFPCERCKSSGLAE